MWQKCEHLPANFVDSGVGSERIGLNSTGSVGARRPCLVTRHRASPPAASGKRAFECRSVSRPAVRREHEFDRQLEQRA